MRSLAVVITVLATCLLLPVAGVTAQSAPSSPPAGALTFAETPYWLADDFRTYWEAHGGLVRFGVPITPPMVDGADRTVQWLERARFEKHPEVAVHNGVLLGLLGVEIAAGRRDEPPFQRVPPPTTPGNQWFQETGHTLDGPFLAAWEAGGGLPIYGFPISEVFEETNREGDTTAVQYFERNRFELHRRADGSAFVQFGRLGAQLYPGGGTVSLPPTDLLPGVELSTSVVPYTITGATAEDLRRQMEQFGPADPTGKRWPASTDIRFHWDYRTRDTAAGCTMQSVRLAAQITFVLPKWNPPAGTPEDLRQRWTAFQAALAHHEAGHQQIGIATLRQLLQQLHALPPASSCAALDAAARAVQQQALVWGDQEHRRYDEETDHGRTQGAYLR